VTDRYGAKGLAPWHSSPAHRGRRQRYWLPYERRSATRQQRTSSAGTPATFPLETAAASLAVGPWLRTPGQPRGSGTGGVPGSTKRDAVRLLAAQLPPAAGHRRRRCGARRKKQGRRRARRLYSGRIGCYSSPPGSHRVPLVDVLRLYRARGTWNCVETRNSCAGSIKFGVNTPPV